MPTITFVDASGARHAVEAVDGISLMEAARAGGVAGILADCGGSCACGTCRIHLNEAWWARLGGPGDLEAATLEAHDDSVPRQRLSCQIVVSEDLDGLVVGLPASQF